MGNKNNINTSSQTEQLFDNAEQYFSALISAIEQAQEQISLEFYIFNYDSVGKKLIAALSSAIKNGAEVKVLIDGIGSSDSGTAAAEHLEKIGATVKIFHPLPWKIAHYPRSMVTGNALYKAITFIQKINHRDHKKTCIIDGKQLWTGSLNISTQHLPVSMGGDNWRDYGLSIYNSNISILAESFNHQWHKAQLKAQPKQWRSQFKQFWDSKSAAARRHKYKLLLTHIKNARHKIWVVSAYFSPSSKIIKALKAASQRGVDVIIIVPRSSDVVLFPYLTSSYYHGLVHAGIRIFEYLPSFLHAKAVIIDDLHLLGSSNFNHRSSLHDLELDIPLAQDDSKQTLKSFIESDINNSQEILADKIPYTIKHRVLGYILRCIRYWM